jgi:hypothetical protein
MINYKEIFELAQQKGYIPYIASNSYPSLKLRDYWYLELCLIHKWLRDIHKVQVLVEWQHAKMFWAVVKGNTPHLETEYCEYGLSYEEALINGIKAALNMLT